MCLTVAVGNAGWRLSPSSAIGTPLAAGGLGDAPPWRPPRRCPALGTAALRTRRLRHHHRRLLIILISIAFRFVLVFILQKKTEGVVYRASGSCTQVTWEQIPGSISH